MAQKNKLIVIALLSLAMALSYGLPKPKYAGTDVLKKLSIPLSIPGWTAKDISSSLNKQDAAYNFISDIIAITYSHKYKGRGLLFLILDAQNFHNPKVCFGSSGYTAKDLADIEFQAKGRAFKAQALFFERPGESYLVTYWLCVDKDIVDWGRQKMKSLFSALFGKKISGLMVRLDIPTSEAGIPDSIKLAKEFIEDIGGQLPESQADYLFGRPK